MLDKRLNRLLNAGYIVLFALLFLFTAASFYLRAWWFAAAESVLCAAALVLFIRHTRTRRRAVTKYIQNRILQSGMDNNIAVASLPVPALILRVETGELVWCSESFLALTGCQADYAHIRISDLIAGFDLKWLKDGQKRHPELVVINNRYFDIHAVLTDAQGGQSGDLCAALYWMDCTEEIRLRTVIRDSRQVLGEVICDNYEEIGKSGNDTARATMMAALDDMLKVWTRAANGLIRKTDRDRYLFVMEEKTFRKYAEKRFEILEAVKKITTPNGLPLTVSIGIGKEGKSLEELEKYAALAVEMALSRGGDQAVVRNTSNFEFYGGMTREQEKSTKVKSRLMANVLKNLMLDASDIYVMGHQVADHDSIGGAAGVVCAARKLQKRASIVINRNHSNVDKVIEMLETTPEYRGIFCTGEEAAARKTAGSLLVIVDTNRATYVEDPSLLGKFERIVVIDHHRRVADYIDNAVLNIHEPAASSVCELLAELLQYIAEPGDIRRTEATAMLAGIFLDTKSFALKTGSRTFEAAAYLRRAGADSVEVKRLFQSDLDNYTQRAELVTHAQFIAGEYAVSIAEEEIDRAVAAQAADDLINISGVTGSFVLFPLDGAINISARSLGRVNVQLIMEKLGGGGHFTTAGAQLRDKSMKEALALLRDAITVYQLEKE